MMNLIADDEQEEVIQLLERAEQIRESAQRLLDEAAAFAELRHLLDEEGHAERDSHPESQPVPRIY